MSRCYVALFIMEQRIKSISEAFSMQPITLQVVEEDKRSKFDPENDIKEIRQEGKQVNTDKMISVYRGYNYDGKMLFEYVMESVNVRYF